MSHCPGPAFSLQANATPHGSNYEFMTCGGIINHGLYRFRSLSGIGHTCENPPTVDRDKAFKAAASRVGWHSTQKGSEQSETISPPREVLVDKSICKMQAWCLF